MTPPQVGVLAALGVLMVACGVGIAALLVQRAARRRRRPAPPVEQPRIAAVPQLRSQAVYVITSLRPRPVDLDATQFIPRQGGRHAAR